MTSQLRMENLRLCNSFTAISIKCWDCRSDADPKCSDPFDNTTFAITDCNDRKLDFMPGLKSTMCRKIRQKCNVLTVSPLFNSLK